jgi:hypothetical protein
MSLVISAQPMQAQIIYEVMNTFRVSGLKFRRYSPLFDWAIFVRYTMPVKAYQWARELLPLPTISSLYVGFGDLHPNQRKKIPSVDEFCASQMLVIAKFWARGQL